MPSQLQAGSRSSYWASWMQVLTFGSAHGGLHKVLSMTTATLKSLTPELLVIGVAKNSMKNIWSAIEHWHRKAGVPLPLAQLMSFKRTFKAASRLLFNRSSSSEDDAGAGRPDASSRAFGDDYGDWQGLMQSGRGSSELPAVRHALGP